MLAHSAHPYDFAVIGAGFFGCRSALMLAQSGAKVLLLEREAAVCVRASRNNQARVHGGYHYPRSRMTALGAARNYTRFCEEFSPLIRSDFTHLYAIAAQGSKVSAYQFEQFCREIGAPLASPTPGEAKLFDPHRIAAVYRAQEVALDTVGLGQMMQEQVSSDPRITLKCCAQVSRLDVQGQGVTIQLDSGDKLAARQVLLANYGGLNQLLTASNLPPMGLKAEIAVMPLVQRPEPLQHLGITVMDGAFFSILPFRDNGACTFSHVRYTPACTIAAPCGENLFAQAEQLRPHAAACFPYIRNDAARYVPALRDCVLSDLLTEVKIVPHKNELDDGRPILFHDASGTFGDAGPAVAAVLGSKLDGIYDWEHALARRLGLAQPSNTKAA